jgi:bacteriocin biosynthesis cyclodehydratase domain-containing protein
VSINEKRHFILLDSFGAEVHRHLKALAHDAAWFMQFTTCDRMPLDFEAKSGILYVPICGSSIRSLCLDLDQRAHKSGFQFMPVAIEGSTLQIGPRVVPGRTPCWECWNERSNSQRLVPDVWSYLLTERDRTTSSQNLAFMPFTASLAAAKIATTLSGLPVAPVGFGSVWRINIFTRDASTFDYVCRHRCSKCSPPDLPLERSVSALRSYFDQER